MRTDLTTALAALLIAAATPVGADPSTGQGYTALDLLQPCQEADNDAREGGPSEIECEQYLTGFAEALRVTGMTGPQAGICLPEVNAADEIRWAFTRWVHGEYGSRKRMTAGDALLAALRHAFPCGN